MWESDKLSSESVSSAIEQLLRNESSERHPVQYADFRSEIDSKQSSELEGFIQSNRHEIEESLTQKLGLEHNRARVAYVEGRMYTWIPRNRSEDLVSAYETEFYYFRDRSETVRIVDELRNQLGIDENLNNSMNRLNEIIDQLTADIENKRVRKFPISEENNRLEGKVVRFYIDTMEMKLSELEGRVTKVAGVGGQAGIENPRFLEGEKLQVLKARLYSTIISDGHLRQDGVVSYYENDLNRIEKVVNMLGNFGDVELKATLHKNVYQTMIPRQFGMMLIDSGMVPGDKSVNNSHLPDFIMSGSSGVKQAYLEELIPEDGYFNRAKGFAWNRSHVLDAGTKVVNDRFVSDITNEHTSFIKKYGTDVEGLVEKTRLPIGLLTELKESDNPLESRVAHELLDIVENNQNNLISDEVSVARSFGLTVRMYPSAIKYSHRTGRVSVKTQAETVDIDSAIQWGMIAPPDDNNKRESVRDWLNENKHRVREQVQRLEEMKIHINQWWIIDNP
jgi:hypothetical protein